MNRLILTLALVLAGCTKSDYYSAPKGACTRLYTGLTHIEVTHECRTSGKNSCAYRQEVRRTKKQYSYNCQWKKYE